MHGPYGWTLWSCLFFVCCQLFEQIVGGRESEDTSSVRRFPVNHPVYDSLRGKCSELSGRLDCEDRSNGYQSFVELTKVGCSYDHANRGRDIQPARGEIVGAILGDIDIPSPESVCNLDGANLFFRSNA